MRLFISWSGEQSRRLAVELQRWIPFVLQPLRRENIWISDRDIEPGKAWSRVLADVLAESQIGLICLTHENRQAPWLHFEAGALAKQLEQSRVVPVLYGMQPEDLAGSPLAQFQAVRLVREDILKLFRMLNSELGDRQVTEEILVDSVDRHLPSLYDFLEELGKIRIDDMEDALPGVIEAFSSKGLAAPHPGRIVHFEEGFESHAIYGIVSELAKKRLLIFGRKNRKVFDKEYSDFFDALPRRVGEGFDFRCLFLSPNASEAILSSAHSDADFGSQLRGCIKRAEECLEKRGLSPGDHIRFYSTHRTVSLMVVDDAVLFAPIDVTEDGRAKPLTKCGFSVVDCRLSLGRNLLNRFLKTWEDARSYI